VQPLLLVFEDLHWIDAETQALLNSLVESLPTTHILLLVNYRPEYQHGWGRKTYYMQLRLDPLPPASAEAFLQALQQVSSAKMLMRDDVLSIGKARCKRSRHSMRLPTGVAPNNTLDRISTTRRSSLCMTYGEMFEKDSWVTSKPMHG
jgi:hypothetical protein